MRSPFQRNTRLGSGTSGSTSTRTAFMPREDAYAAADTYFYFGWTSHNGGWLVRRQARTTGAIEQATVAANAAHNSFTSAWANRETLIFEVKNDN